MGASSQPVKAMINGPKPKTLTLALELWTVSTTQAPCFLPPSPSPHIGSCLECSHAPHPHWRWLSNFIFSTD